MKEKLFLPEGISREYRTKYLNDSIRNVKPSICVDRAKLVTECYKKYYGAPAVILRAMALKHVLENMTIFIDKEELIVGNHGSRPRSAPIFPEFGAFDKKELDLMPERKVDTLQISDDDKNYLLNEIYPWWEGKCDSDLAQNYLDEKILEVINSPYRVFNPISRTRSGYGHYIPDVSYILHNGFFGIEIKAKEKLKNLNLEEKDYTERNLPQSRE